MVTSPWEAIHITNLLLNGLNEYGIDTKGVYLDQHYFFELSPAMQEWTKDLLTGKNQLPEADSVHIRLGKDFVQKILKRFFSPIENYSSDFFHQLTRSSHGGPGKDIFDPLVVYLAGAGFLKFKLDISLKKLRQSFQTYLKRYEGGKLILSNDSEQYFKQSYCQNALSNYLDEVRRLQEEPIVLQLSHQPADQFLQSWRKHDSEGYQSWQDGVYEFRFWETLLLAEANDLISITGFKTDIGEASHHHHLERIGFNQLPLLSAVQFSINYPDAPIAQVQLEEVMKSKQIKLIQVAQSQTDKFEVRPNYATRIYAMYQSKTSGEIFYTLAKKGKIRYDADKHGRMLETINSNSRFILFSKKTPYAPSNLILLTKDSKWIKPHPDVTFELVATEDLRKTP